MRTVPAANVIGRSFQREATSTRALSDLLRTARKGEQVYI